MTVSARPWEPTGGNRVAPRGAAGGPGRSQPCRPGESRCRLRSWWIASGITRGPKRLRVILADIVGQTSFSTAFGVEESRFFELRQRRLQYWLEALEPERAGERPALLPSREPGKKSASVSCRARCAAVVASRHGAQGDIETVTDRTTVISTDAFVIPAGRHRARRRRPVVLRRGGSVR